MSRVCTHTFVSFILKCVQRRFFAHVCVSLWILFYFSLSYTIFYCFYFFSLYSKISFTVLKFFFLFGSKIIFNVFILLFFILFNILSILLHHHHFRGTLSYKLTKNRKLLLATGVFVLEHDGVSVIFFFKRFNGIVTRFCCGQCC